MKLSTHLLVLTLFATAVQAQDAAVDIGSRRELFVDRLIVDELKDATLKLHTPQLMPPISPARPHGHYATVLRAKDKFQFYYRGDKDLKVTWKTHGIEAYHDGEVTLYSERPDAIHWTLPKLGLCVRLALFDQSQRIGKDQGTRERQQWRANGKR